MPFNLAVFDVNAADGIGHGENENISASDRNKLKELVDEYIKELNGGQK